VAQKLTAMLAEPRYAERARTVGQQLSQEDGVRTACDALEELHAKTRRASDS
jgi:UDP:flavonoid glycosyltransferase YjiC (YdhE family)